MLGRAGSWSESPASGGLGTGARVWLYQDFVAGSGPNLTISQNDNGTGVTFDSSRIVDSSASITNTTGYPVYTNSASKIPANLVSVATQTGSSVTLNGTPAVGEGVLRVWYLYAVSSSDSLAGAIVAPDFVTTQRIAFLDADYLNQRLNLSDLASASSARTNLGFTAQTAGRVLLGDGSTTFTSDSVLFFDTSTKALGIGTASPSQRLHVFSSAASVAAMVETQFTSAIPELRLAAARTSNADLATNDVAGRINFYSRYNSTNASIAYIDAIYTGSGTTQLGDIVLYVANAGSPAEAMRVLASKAITMQSTLDVATSVTTPIIYGSSSNSGSLTLRSTSAATKGNIIVADQTAEKILAGVQGSITTFNAPFNFMVPNTSGANNGLCVFENSKTEFNAGSGAPNSAGWALLPKGPSGTAELRAVTAGGDTPAFLRYYDSGFGLLGGYIKLYYTWGFQNSDVVRPTMDVSGVTGQVADLVRYFNQTDFGNQVASIGPDGHMRAPAGSASIASFAGFADTNTGLYFPAADTIGLTTGGTLRASLDSTGLLLKNALLLEDPGAGTNTVTILAGVVSASYSITLPLLQGAAGTTLINDGSGVLSWTNPNTGKAGTVALSISTTTKAITFATARANANYTVVWAFKNTTDSTPAQRAWNVIAQSTTGFTVEWNDPLDTANYVGLWAVLEHYDP